MVKKLLSAKEIRELEQVSMKIQGISSLQLMERAAEKATLYLANLYTHRTCFLLVCGKGNNGGDGLGMARMLYARNHDVIVVDGPGVERSKDNATQFELLKSTCPQVSILSEFPQDVKAGTVLIDALFGTGLSRPLSEEYVELVQNINACSCRRISIDIPSGLYTDKAEAAPVAVMADITLTFHNYKKSFLFSESGCHCGRVVVLDIGLENEKNTPGPGDEYILDEEKAAAIYRERSPFEHKGHNGHVLLAAGGAGKMGACLMAARAALRSGAGLLTVLVPEEERVIIQVGLPEAMCITYGNNGGAPALPDATVITAGCGMGTGEAARKIVQALLSLQKPLILDADALNLLSMHKELMDEVPEGSLLTPHPKEFDRMFGKHTNSFSRYETQKKISEQKNVYILLKGRYSSLSTPGGNVFFNSSGNAGLARGGSGDTLCGILSACFARYRNMCSAALLGMYLHGMAADLAIETIAEESLLASDVTEKIPVAFNLLKEKKRRDGNSLKSSYTTIFEYIFLSAFFT